MIRNRIAAAAVLAGAIACAKPLPPPGGEVDRSPPQVITTTPAARAVVPDWREPVVFVFDERLSERDVERRVTVSPQTSAVRIDRGGNEVRVSLERGWQPNTIYRVALEPGLNDLFGNRTERAYEVVFSTGPEIPDNALAGLVTDRITGKPTSEARVEAILRPDSLIYVTTTDSAGFFALRGIPLGEYEVKIFRDRVPNQRLDYSEPFVRVMQQVGSGDTLLLDRLQLLAADTTPARVLRAEAQDSVTVRVTLDDALDPTRGLGGVEATLVQVSGEDSVRVPTREVLLPFALEARRAEEAAARDTTAAGRARRARAAAAAPDTALLPTRELVVLTPPLTPDTRYVIELRGIVNIHALPGGGGAAPFRTKPAPPARDTAATQGQQRQRAPADFAAPPPPPRDTAGVRRDTAAVRRDTAAARRDTAAVRRDTAAVRRDTAAVRRDTSRVRR